MYLFITITVQFISSFSAYPAQWPFNSSTGVPTHRSTRNKIYVYLLASLPSNHKDLPVTTTTRVPAHKCTRSWPYAFIFILSFWLTVKIYSSTVLLFYMSTDLPVHQYTCSVYFLFFCISYAMTFQLLYWGTYPHIHPKINLPVYPQSSLSSNDKDLPVTTTTCISAHRCIRSWPYLFIFILSFRLTAEIYPSTFLLLYMYTDAPVHQYTCSAYFFLLGITCTMTFQLIYCGTYPKINLTVYLHASLSSHHKDLPDTTTRSIPAQRCTRSWPYLFFFIPSFRLTV